MDALPPKIAKPIGRQWPLTGTPPWDLRYSPHASSAVLPSRASPGIQSPTGTIVHIGVRVLNRTGLFGEEYKAWILQGNNPNNAIDFAAFKSFWENAVQIAAFTAVLASTHGYGMGVANYDDTASLTDAVSNFGTAYAATQESL